MEDFVNPGGPEVTDVRIYPYEMDRGNHKIMAYADVELGGMLWIKGIRLIKTKQQGYFVSLPSKRVRGEVFETVVIDHPEYLRYLRRMIRLKYQEYTGERYGT